MWSLEMLFEQEGDTSNKGKSNSVYPNNKKVTFFKKTINNVRKLAGYKINPHMSLVLMHVIDKSQQKETES